MKKLITKIGLTTKELWLAAFLIITFAAGLIIKYSGFKKPEEFDYIKTDKNFEKKVTDIFSSLKEKSQDSLQKLRAKELMLMADSIGAVIDNKNISTSNIKPGTVININTAGAEELSTLPGIGEVTAANIIEYRESRGGFKVPEDLMKIKGIGEKKFGKIKEFISVK